MRICNSQNEFNQIWQLACPSLMILVCEKSDRKEKQTLSMLYIIDWVFFFQRQGQKSVSVCVNNIHFVSGLVLKKWLKVNSHCLHKSQVTRYWKHINKDIQGFRFCLHNGVKLEPSLGRPWLSLDVTLINRKTNTTTFSEPPNSLLLWKPKKHYSSLHWILRSACGSEDECTFNTPHLPPGVS